MLTVENITYRYHKNIKPVIKDMSFVLNKNEIIGITGKSGAGKSTIAHLLLGLLTPKEGAIALIGAAAKERKTATHPDTILVMQNPDHSFNPNKSLAYSLNEIRHFLPDKPDTHLFNKKINGLMQDLQLDSTLLTHYPETVSGGQLQRFSILRALLLEPKIIIFDESTAMLDTSVQAKIVRLLLNIKAKNNLAYLFISHDVQMISLIANKTILVQ